MTTGGTLSELHVVMVGPFPAPLHGFSFANLRMESRLKDLFVKTSRVDVAPGRGSSWRTRALDFCHRVSSGIRTITRPTAKAGNRFCYLGLSGGERQLLDILFIALARLFRWRLVVHHHNFSYINSFSFLTYLFIKVSGRRATHVTLSKAMGQKLRDRYSDARKVITLSNLSLGELPPGLNNRQGPPLVIGYLSNITIEKGFDRFLKILETVASAGLPVRAVVGGPFGDETCQNILELAIARRIPVRYLGPIYGAAKQAFFDEIDLFIFPTSYVNEAEPFVVIEAIAAGVPVVSSARGCIPELLSGGAGFIVDFEQKGDAAQIVFDGFSNPTGFDSIRRNTREAFLDLKSLADLQWQGFVEQLKSPDEKTGA
jgi:glycosyltransferase involved in cell wall biosynthesis